MDIDLSIIGITYREYCKIDILSAIKKAHAGGIKTIQIREKNLSDRDYFYEAESAVKLTEEIDIDVIINDRYDIAQASGASGVHIGNNDIPLSAVKKHFKGIIGKTVKTIEEAINASMVGADYISIGPFFDSHTKPQKNRYSPEILEEITDEVSIPVVAIGGIKPENARELLKKGASGIAVSESLFKGDIKKNAIRLREVVNKYGGY